MDEKETRTYSTGFKILAMSIPFIVILVLLIAAEIVLRITWEDGRYFDNGPDRQGGINVQVNSYGFRGPEIPDKKSGETVIACVGNSTVWGMSERFEDTWPKQLDSMIDNDSIRVLNASGFGNHPHYFLANFGKIERLQPDLILYQLCMNDFQEVTDQPDQVKEVQAIDNAAWHMRMRMKVNKLLLFRRSGLSRLYTVGAIRAFARKLFPYNADGLIELKPWSYYCLGIGDSLVTEHAWAATLRTLAELKDASNSIGAEFAITLLPYRFIISDDKRDNEFSFDRESFKIDPGERLERFGEENDIPFLDLTPFFGIARKEMETSDIPYNPLFIPGDYCHPNATGYGLVAKATKPFIMDLIRDTGQ